MTVYVDDMKAAFGRMVMCHMLADTDEELHAMADRIGVARKWWQSPAKSSGSHYDIALSKRALAVAAGAVEVSLKQIAAMNARRRILGCLGDPQDALEWLRCKEDRIGAWFKEEESGLVMYDKLWYVLSDSGSAYFGYGFATSRAAVEAFRTSEHGASKLALPKYQGPKKGWRLEAANVLLGSELRDFQDNQ